MLESERHENNSNALSASIHRSSFGVFSAQVVIRAGMLISVLRMVAPVALACKREARVPLGLGVDVILKCRRPGHVVGPSAFCRTVGEDHDAVGEDGRVGEFEYAR